MLHLNRATKWGAGGKPDRRQVLDQVRRNRLGWKVGAAACLFALVWWLSSSLSSLEQRDQEQKQFSSSGSSGDSSSDSDSSNYNDGMPGGFAGSGSDSAFGGAQGASAAEWTAMSNQAYERAAASSRKILPFEWDKYPAMPENSPALVRIFTGTHGLPDVMALNLQDPLCGALARGLHSLWTAFDADTYGKAKSLVRSSLLHIAKKETACKLNGSPTLGQVWSFPIAHTATAACESPNVNIALRKKPWKKDTKVFFPWFLLRPDLVTLDMLAAEARVRLVIHATVGHDYRDAAFTQEEACPRFNTVLADHDVYKERLLLVGVADLNNQLNKLKRAKVVINVCSQATIAADQPELAEDLAANNQRASREWALSNESERGDPRLQRQMPVCNARPGLSAPAGKSHMATITMLRPFMDIKLDKNHFGGPRLVFIAGLEGVGHHLFSALGRKHTYRFLYEALTDHLGDSAWSTDGEAAYGRARQRLVDAMARIKEPFPVKGQSQLNVVFLNTVFSEQAVNMYSFPWGGPRCHLKRYARIMCNIDVVELARMAEEAAVDFRVIVLRRSIGAAVVSAALHRPYGVLPSETRMLTQSWGLLRSSLNALDQRFFMHVQYEALMRDPDRGAQALLQFLSAEPNSAIATQIPMELAQSVASVQMASEDAWMDEVSLEDLEYMKDLLHL